MRYYYTDGKPVPITNAIINGYRVSNPTDAVLDANGVGYPLKTAPAPEVTDETKKLDHIYTLTGGVIVEAWTIVDKTPAELVAMYREQIEAIYAESADYTENGQILYDVTGKYYIPRWVYQFYNSVELFKESYFPTEAATLAISATDGTSDNFTYAQFIQLYNAIGQTYMAYNAMQDAKIAALVLKIRELENE